VAGNMRYLRLREARALDGDYVADLVRPRACAPDERRGAFEWQPSLTCSPAKAGVQSGSPPSRGNTVRRKSECREPGMTEVDQAGTGPNDPPPPGGGVAEGDGGGVHGTAVPSASPSVRLRPATSPLRGRIVEDGLPFPVILTNVRIQSHQGCRLEPWVLTFVRMTDDGSAFVRNLLPQQHASAQCAGDQLVQPGVQRVVRG
jgi:hypothetical protein